MILFFVTNNNSNSNRMSQPAHTRSYLNYRPGPNKPEIQGMVCVEWFFYPFVFGWVK